MVDASGCGPGDKVLEICSGTCELSLAFARKGINTVAVDLARDMLRIGNRKSSYDNLDFLESDALQLPFKDKSFNVVAVSLALHHSFFYCPLSNKMNIKTKKQVLHLESRGRKQNIE